MEKIKIKSCAIINSKTEKKKAEKMIIKK